MNRRISSVRAAYRALSALVLLNGLAGVHIWTYGFSLVAGHRMVRLPVASGRTIVMGVSPQQDDPYHYYPLGMGLPEPSLTVLLIDLWDRNTSQHSVIHLAGVNLPLRLITLLPLAATVASLMLLVPVLLLGYRRRDQGCCATPMLHGPDCRTPRFGRSLR